MEFDQDCEHAPLRVFVLLGERYITSGACAINIFSGKKQFVNPHLGMKDIFLS